MSELVMKNFILYQCTEYNTTLKFILYLLACSETVNTSDSC